MAADNSRSLRHLNRQLLGKFLRNLENLDPWWVSIVLPVNGDLKTTLTSLLGFEHQLGLEFLCSTGLLKSGTKPNSFSVVYEEWELFVVQEKLQKIMETINRTSVSRSK
jgi:hypothetical protein